MTEFNNAAVIATEQPDLDGLIRRLAPLAERFPGHIDLEEIEVDTSQTEEDYTAELAAVGVDACDEASFEQAMHRVRRQLGIVESPPPQLRTIGVPSTMAVDASDASDPPIERVKILDTSLRDGGQIPCSSTGAAGPSPRMSIPAKVDMARAIASAGVDIIEIGFATERKPDIEASEAIAVALADTDIIVCIMATCCNRDIDIARKHLRHAKRSRIHLLLSELSISHLIGNREATAREIARQAEEGISYARSFFADIEFSIGDATSRDVQDVCDIIEAAAAAGASTINLPDTRGIATPTQFGRLIGAVKERLSRDQKLDHVIVSAHCHNDLGVAVANSLAACEAGARQIECTVNGIGPRSGNAALEEVVAALEACRGHFRLATGVDSEALPRVSRMIEHVTGIIVPDQKPIVGRNIVGRNSVAAGVITRRGTPADGGRSHRRSIGTVTDRFDVEEIIDKALGIEQIAGLIEREGHHIGPMALDSIYAEFQELARVKSKIYVSDVVALVVNQMVVDHLPFWEITGMTTTIGTGVPPTCSVRIRTPEGKFVQDAAAGGGGPIDAVFHAIERATKMKAELADYRVRNISRGRDALCEVLIKLIDRGESYFGRSVSTDLIEASARSYMMALDAIWGRRHGQDIHDATAPAEARAGIIPMRPSPTTSSPRPRRTAGG
jgi:2-isopropylmalate synthase